MVVSSGPGIPAAPADAGSPLQPGAATGAARSALPRTGDRAADPATDPATGRAAGRAAGRAGPSVLFRDAASAGPGPAPGGLGDEPAWFGDLNLDQVRDAILGGFEEYALAPFFGALLPDEESVTWRQEVFADLEGRPLLDDVVGFSESMAALRRTLAGADGLENGHQQARWRLDAARAYVDALRAFDDAIRDAAPASRALGAIAAYLHRLVTSQAFGAMADEATAVLERLDRVHYGLQLKGLRVAVRRYAGEADYSADVDATFERFRHGTAQDYRLDLRSWKTMNRVETRVLDCVAGLFPDEFAALHAFTRRWAGFCDPVVLRFEREVQFYVSYLRWMASLGAGPLAWCRPEVTLDPARTFAWGAFDVALAQRLGGTGVVTNDFELAGPERILVVTGPNQGGKTTFARMWGQLHHLAAIGCPVPGRRVHVGLCDAIHTHFEREEDLSATGGKLEDDLVRIREILGRATARSVLVLNEIFTSTTLDDATYLGHEVLARVEEIGAACAYVTFVDELASRSPATVSMVGTVDPHDPSVRTFRVVRRPADGRSYAIAIAEKYGLTYERLRGRVGRRPDRADALGTPSTPAAPDRAGTPAAPDRAGTPAAPDRARGRSEQNPRDGGPR